MCNRRSIFVGTSKTPTTNQSSNGSTDPYEGSPRLSGEADLSNLIVVGLSVGIGAIALAAVLLLSFWCWSNRRRNEILDGNFDINLEDGRDSEGSRSDSPDPAIDLASLNLSEKIGRGRFSEVWKGSLSDNLVAVKIFPKNEKESWKTERDVYTKPEIKHENLRRFVAADRRVVRNNTQYWIVLEYHELGSLSDYLKANVLTFEKVCEMAGSVAAGLAYLHSEIVSDNGVKPAIAHRDVKSRNVLVKRDLSCCICDLGLGIKFQPGTSLTESQGQVSACTVSPPLALRPVPQTNP